MGRGWMPVRIEALGRQGPYPIRGREDKPTDAEGDCAWSVLLNAVLPACLRWALRRDVWLSGSMRGWTPR